MPTTEEKLASLINHYGAYNKGHVRIVAPGKVKPTEHYHARKLYRINNCCGVAWKGKWHYLHIWGRPVDREDTTKTQWDEKHYITVGFVGKTVKPKLGEGRQFVRLNAGGRDFVISWRNE